VSRRTHQLQLVRLLSGNRSVIQFIGNVSLDRPPFGRPPSRACSRSASEKRAAEREDGRPTNRPSFSTCLAFACHILAAGLSRDYRSDGVSPWTLLPSTTSPPRCPDEPISLHDTRRDRQHAHSTRLQYSNDGSRSSAQFPWLFVVRRPTEENSINVTYAQRRAAATVHRTSRRRMFNDICITSVSSHRGI